MKKISGLCLMLLLLVSCTTMDEYDRELERRRAEQLEGVKFPPATVIDCYNIMGSRSAVTGKIIMENNLPVIKFSSYSCANGQIYSYRPDKNMVTCNYTFPGADPQPYFTVTVVMVVSADKKIYAVCKKANTSDYFAEEPSIRYYTFKSRDFENIEYKILPDDVKYKIGGIAWPEVNRYWY